MHLCFFALVHMATHPRTSFLLTKGCMHLTPSKCKGHRHTTHVGTLKVVQALQQLSEFTSMRAPFHPQQVSHEYSHLKIVELFCDFLPSLALIQLFTLQHRGVPLLKAKEIAACRVSHIDEHQSDTLA